ncbi:uncharacterized protein LOC123662877 [Melitaea cinxia]|uniref:uncharacterized protein LOC123662877 n=1 Tax=Melitaea cinxia TaxID=113334 RepID=UPI001E272CBF|nr:uncharacterized protein LOC123662877 [Melitaea cinxia]
MVSINATEADLEYLRDDPPFPHKSACVITCLLEKVGVAKNGKYSKTGFMVTVSPLVLHNMKKLEHMKNVSENCEKEIKPNEDPCQLGNEITICVFKYAPELHFKS